MAASGSFALRALSGHRCGSDRRAVIAPGTALVIDDGDDVGIAEHGTKRRHRTGVDNATDVDALDTVQQRANMRRRISGVDGGIALERRECAGQALTAGLMTSRTIGGEQRLTLD